MMEFLDALDSVLYYPILLVVMGAAGLYFSVRMGFVQLRRLPEAIHLVMAKPADGSTTSPFQALMVSTAACVGTGNIIGVSTAICLGGPGAVFWMTLMAIIGAASSFTECTLAQIFKRRKEDGSSYGGPAYYIEDALHNKALATAFVIFLLLTYSFGFNLLCSYNVQSTFSVYSFYNPSVTPAIIGAIMAALVGICVLGGSKAIEKAASLLVPVMGVAYVVVTVVVLVMNYQVLPQVIETIFADAFNFRAIFGGIGGSCLVMGIKRGLYSNEAGVGSAPNAAASATTTHPVKQGLVQMLSVYIDTVILCNATALMCLVSGVQGNAENAGAVWVQTSLYQVLGSFGPMFITVAMILFSFTTLIGNIYYCQNGLAYLNHKKMPSQGFMKGFYLYAVLIVFVGAIIPMAAAWDLADIMMGGMTLINLTACLLLSGVVVKAYQDYCKQKAAGLDPQFLGSAIGLKPSEIEFWKDGTESHEEIDEDDEGLEALSNHAGPSL